MAIQVKLAGELKRYGQARQSLETDGAMTVTEAIERLGIQEEPDEILVIVNDEVVPPGERADRRLADEDQLTLTPQLRGG